MFDFLKILKIKQFLKNFLDIWVWVLINRKAKSGVFKDLE